MKCLHENHPTQEKEKSEKIKEKKKKKLEQEQKYTWPRPQSNVSQPSHHAQAQCETHRRKKTKTNQHQKCSQQLFSYAVLPSGVRGGRLFDLGPSCAGRRASGPPTGLAGTLNHQNTIPKCIACAFCHGESDFKTKQKARI